MAGADMETVTRPDPAGRAQLVAAAAALRPYTPPPPRRRGLLRRLGWKWALAFVVADLLVGSLLWHVVDRHQDSPVTAVTRVADLAGRGDWAAVYDHLCTADHRQFSASDVASGGSAALQLLHGFAGVRIGAAHAVSVHLIGPFALPAEEVSGQLVPQLGPPVDFHVTTVREVTGWRLCLSVGGYGAPAFGVDVPLGS